MAMEALIKIKRGPMTVARVENTTAKTIGIANEVTMMTGGAIIRFTELHKRITNGASLVLLNRSVEEIINTRIIIVKTIIKTVTKSNKEMTVRSPMRGGSTLKISENLKPMKSTVKTMIGIMIAVATIIIITTEAMRGTTST